MDWLDNIPGVPPWLEWLIAVGTVLGFITALWPSLKASLIAGKDRVSARNRASAEENAERILGRSVEIDKAIRDPGKMVALVGSELATMLVNLALIVLLLVLGGNLVKEAASAIGKDSNWVQMPATLIGSLVAIIYTSMTNARINIKDLLDPETAKDKLGRRYRKLMARAGYDEKQIQQRIYDAYFKEKIDQEQ